MSFEAIGLYFLRKLAGSKGEADAAVITAGQAAWATPEVQAFVAALEKAAAVNKIATPADSMTQPLQPSKHYPGEGGKTMY